VRTGADLTGSSGTETFGVTVDVAPSEGDASTCANAHSTPRTKAISQMQRHIRMISTTIRKNPKFHKELWCFVWATRPNRRSYAHLAVH
jgi:hypothetical protein